MLIGIDANEANMTSKRVGVNQYAFDLLHAIYRLKPRHNFEIYLKNPRLTDLPEPRDGWSYRYIPFPKLWTQTRLPLDLYLHKPRPDVFLSLGHYAPRWSPVKTVICIMDLGFLDNPNQFTPKDFNQLKNWTKYSVNKSSKIIAISQATKKDILRHYQYKAENIIVSYPSYDIENFFPKKDQKVLDKYDIKVPYILFLSSLKPNKNVEGLIKAFSMISNKHNLILVIAGKKGWQYDAIFSLVKELQITDRVIFTGFVEEHEAPILMSMAKAFVLPSFHEGFGIPVLEAMACGTPVVTSNIASLPEVGGNAAVYIDPGNINSIAQGIEIAIGKNRSKLVKAGLEQVKLFSWSKTAQEVINTLENTI